MLHNFSWTFAPMARHKILWMLVVLVGQFKWKIFHLYMKSVFLNGFLEEDIFIEQPKGNLILRAEDKVYKVRKLFLVQNKHLKPSIIGYILT